MFGGSGEEKTGKNIQQLVLKLLFLSLFFLNTPKQANPPVQIYSTGSLASIYKILVCIRSEGGKKEDGFPVQLLKVVLPIK